MFFACSLPLFVILSPPEPFCPAIPFFVRGYCFFFLLCWAPVYFSFVCVNFTRTFQFSPSLASPKYLQSYLSQKRFNTLTTMCAFFPCFSSKIFEEFYSYDFFSFALYSHYFFYLFQKLIACMIFEPKIRQNWSVLTVKALTYVSGYVVKHAARHQNNKTNLINFKKRFRVKWFLCMRWVN